MTEVHDKPGLDRVELDHVLTVLQNGVVARGQLRRLGAEPHEIRSLLRRGELVHVHPGVYVDHNGPLSWEQRAWAAVLAHWPAALARESALPSPPDQGPVHVAIDRKRSVVAVPGVHAHRTASIDERVQWHRSPPTVRLEHAAIDVARDRKDVVDRFRVFADVVQTRRTTAFAITAALRRRRGVPDRALLLEMLSDLGNGASSVLEREYLILERSHGLPSSGSGASRQAAARVDGAQTYRDVDYAEFGVLVELDGRAFHDTATARDRDAARDLVAAVRDRRVAVRLTYGLVLRDGCRTIGRVGELLRRGGWLGSITRCPTCPADVDLP